MQAIWGYTNEALFVMLPLFAMFLGVCAGMCGGMFGGMMDECLEV